MRAKTQWLDDELKQASQPGNSRPPPDSPSVKWRDQEPARSSTLGAKDFHHHAALAHYDETRNYAPSPNNHAQNHAPSPKTPTISAPSTPHYPT